jgi:hypothetical protein
MLIAGDGTWTRNAVKSDMGDKIYFTCTVDSIDTLESNSFDLGDFDGYSWSTYPLNYSIYMNSADNDTPLVDCFIYGTNDGSNWFTVDTLFESDSLETVRSQTADFNDIKADKYKMIIYGKEKGDGEAHNNGPNTSVSIIFPLYKRE